MLIMRERKNPNTVMCAARRRRRRTTTTTTLERKAQDKEKET
jgi:hypothetical protein